MLKEHLDLLGINPRIIHQLSECLNATKEFNEELAADLDPIGYQRTQLTMVQVELMIAYLS